MITLAVAVFLANIMLDIFYAKYTLAVAEKRAMASAIWSVGIIIAGGLSIISYTHEPLLLIPAAIGCFIGTYVTVQRS